MKFTLIHHVYIHYPGEEEQREIVELVSLVWPARVRAGISPGGTQMAFVVDITDEQKVTISYTGADAAGNPEPLPVGSVLTAVVANTAICTATPGADGTSVEIASENAPPGVSSVGVSQVDIEIALPDGSILKDSGSVNVTPSAVSQLLGTISAPVQR